MLGAKKSSDGGRHINICYSWRESCPHSCAFDLLEDQGGELKVVTLRCSSCITKLGSNRSRCLLWVISSSIFGACPFEELMGTGCLHPS